ncbi:MAG: hypothetical protein PWP69_24 [Enterococcus sp.]|nr:hypothetical protein [Enterococcus sp.]
MNVSRFSSPFIEDTSILDFDKIKMTIIQPVLVPIYKGYFNIIQKQIIMHIHSVFSSLFIEDTSILERGFKHENNLYNVLVPFIEDTSILLTRKI